MKRWQRHAIRRYEYERARLQLANFSLLVVMSFLMGLIVWYLRTVD